MTSQAEADSSHLAYSHVHMLYNGQALLVHAQREASEP